MATFSLVVCNVHGWPWRHVLRFKPSSISPVARSLVVALLIAERKVKLKQTVKCLRLISIAFKENHSTTRITLALYLTEIQTVGVTTFGSGHFILLLHLSDFQCYASLQAFNLDKASFCYLVHLIGVENSQEDVIIALGVLLGVFFIVLVASMVLNVYLWRRLQGKG